MHRRHALHTGLLFLTMLALSAAALAAVSDPRVERIDERHVVVSWRSPDAVDVYEAQNRDSGIARAKLLSGANRQGRYVAAVKAGQRPYFLVRDVGTGQVVRVAERVLPLEHASNFRDLGGYETVDGRRVRWGRIYRSGAMPLLTERDIEYIRALDVHTTIDLRSTDERELAPSRLVAAGFDYVAVDYPVNDLLSLRAESDGVAPAPRERVLYRAYLTRLAPQYEAIFRALRSNSGATAFNCTAGQDRTGVAAALILLALGVPREAILEDYQLSPTYRNPQYEVTTVDPAKYPNNPAAPLFVETLKHKPTPLRYADGRPFLAEALDEIDTQWGGIDNYLEQVLHITRADIGVLRAKYLECSPAAGAERCPTPSASR